MKKLGKYNIDQNLIAVKAIRKALSKLPKKDRARVLKAVTFLSEPDLINNPEPK